MNHTSTNKRALDIDGRSNFRASSEKLNVTKHRVGFWRDLDDNQRWKYDELSPVQLLEKLKLDECLANKDELARTEFFWRRRPRFLPAAGYIVRIIVGLGLPVWLFIVRGNRSAASNSIGGGDQRRIIRSVRWRRQYELSINRLIRQMRMSNRTYEVRGNCMAPTAHLTASTR